MNTQTLPPSLCRVVIDPRTGCPVALVASGPNAGYIAAPCGCGCNAWHPVRMATAEDLYRIDRIVRRAKVAEFN